MDSEIAQSFPSGMAFGGETAYAGTMRPDIVTGATLPDCLQLHREMEVGYCRLVTISTDSLAETNEFRSGVGAHWTFLSDPGRKVQKDLDIASYAEVFAEQE